MKRHLLLSLLLLLTLVGRGLAQNRTVTGRVLDSTTKEGIPGVSVILKGTTTGTATNADGNYSLSVPGSGGTLQFKYLGYATQESPISAGNTIDISLAPDTKELKEVVVTALGVPREARALGFATSQVKAEQIVQKSEPDLLRTLTGKVPGVNIVSSSGVPGASSRITIRGNSSFLGNNQPLFIVDGVPYDNSQTESDNQLVRGAGYASRSADIDPNNIESINVLKGAAAAALYGSRAAGGVIVITTKTGSGKRGNKGVQIGYNSSYSIEKIAALPDYQNTYGNGSNFTGPYTANGSWGPKFGSVYAPTRLPHPQAGQTVRFPNNDTPVTISDTATIPYKAYPENTKSFFDTGSLFENSLSLTGTGDNATFSTVISRADQQGIIPNSYFVRNNISAGGSGNFNKFTVGGTVGYTNTTQRGPQLGANNAVGNATAFARTLFLPRNLDLQGLPYINDATNNQTFAWLSNQADNPIWSVRNNGFESRVDRITGSTSLSYAIKEWLTVSYTGGVNTYTDIRRTIVRPGSNAYNAVGNILEDNIQNTELEQTALITFNKNLTEDISLRASLGQNINQREFNSTSYSGNTIIVFGIDNIQNTVSKNTNGYDYSKRRLMGILGDMTVGYKDWAFITVTGRNDWSSTLNVNGELGRSGRSFFYPSVSGSVVVNEALGLNIPWLNLAKLRGAYARVGRDASPYSAGPTRYFINPEFGNVGQGIGTAFPFNSTTGLQLFSQIGNPALTPEFTSELEVGGEFDLFKRRISLSASYYDRRSTNQIAARPLPASTGFGSEITNFGELSNKGIEAGLTVIPVDVKGFRWTSTVNYTRNRNIVEKLIERVPQLFFGTSFSGGIRSVLLEGQPYGVFLGSTAARDTARDSPTKGALLIDPKTGRMIATQNPSIIGNPNPDFIMGFINQFTYKGFTLNTLIDFRKGGSLYSTTIQSYLGRGVTKDTEDRERLVIIKGVQGSTATNGPLINADGSRTPNSTAISLNDYYFSSAGGGLSAAINTADEFSIYDATTVRLREVTLGYELPKSLLSKTPFGQIGVTVSARNLFWYSPNIPKYTNFDPETSTFGASNQQGLEYTNAPTTRRYGVNLHVTF